MIIKYNTSSIFSSNYWWQQHTYYYSSKEIPQPFIQTKSKSLCCCHQYQCLQADAIHRLEFPSWRVLGKTWILPRMTFYEWKESIHPPYKVMKRAEARILSTQTRRMSLRRPAYPPQSVILKKIVRLNHPITACLSMSTLHPVTKRITMYPTSLYILSSRPTGITLKTRTKLLLI